VIIRSGCYCANTESCLRCWELWNQAVLRFSQERTMNTVVCFRVTHVDILITLFGTEHSKFMYSRLRLGRQQSATDVHPRIILVWSTSEEVIPYAHNVSTCKTLLSYRNRISTVLVAAVLAGPPFTPPVLGMLPRLRHIPSCSFLCFLTCTTSLSFAYYSGVIYSLNSMAKILTGRA